MNDTVMKILELVSEYAEHYAEDRKWGTFTADTTKSHRQRPIGRYGNPQK